MTTMAVPVNMAEGVSADGATLPSIVWAFVQRVVESAVAGEVYTYIYRGTQGTTEYVLTPLEKPLPPGAPVVERSIVLAARPRTPSGVCTFRTLAFRRENGVWIKSRH